MWSSFITNMGAVIGGHSGQQFVSSGTVNINGKSYTGKTVTISNNKVYVDGKEQDDLSGGANKSIQVKIEGDAKADISVTHGTIDVAGSASKVHSTSGNISIGGGVSGNVQSVSGDINVQRDVGGDVYTTSGDVTISGNASGSVKTTSGKIKREKKQKWVGHY